MWSSEAHVEEIRRTQADKKAPHAAWITQPDGSASREVRHYFEEGFWRSKSPQSLRERVGAYHRQLSTYFNT